jgi:hypothetical protein
MKFFCEKCNYKCNKQSEYNKHLMTAKHEKLTKLTKKSPKISNPHMCCNCNKIYKSRMGLWQHKQKCTSTISVKPDDNALDVKNNPIIVDTMLQLIKQNQDFKELIIELSRKDTTTNNTFNNTTNNNQKFNLNFFLNNTCKDAMNMSEFIENMEVQFEDIENIGRDGYVTGMTNMIMSRIKNLEITKRPMHCTDLKRETIYIKDNDVWEKDNDNVKLHNMIQCIAHKNYAILPAWRDKNPDCLNSDTPKFDFCIKMMTNVLGDAGEGQVKLDNKVIRNIAKHINVDKNSIM